MADVQPLRALHYDLKNVGPLADLVAPPYDVIDSAQRSRLAGRSPYNVVEIDLPEATGDPYDAAARTLAGWEREGAVVQDAEPAVWALSQEYDVPGGGPTRAPRVLLPGAGGGVRRRADQAPRAHAPRPEGGPAAPHARDEGQPLPDLLPLLRPGRRRVERARPFAAQEPWGDVTDDDGTRHRVWRVADDEAIAAVQEATAGAELLIADGHHRYETARAYADEVGGEGPHRYVLMCLVALEDPGLTVFPTHRLVSGLRAEQHETLARALPRGVRRRGDRRARRSPPRATARCVSATSTPTSSGRFMLTLKDPAIADRALQGHSEPYRRLDTAVLEALILKGALGMTRRRHLPPARPRLRARPRRGARAGRSR